MNYSEIENQVRQLSTVKQLLLAERILQRLRESALPEAEARKLHSAVSRENVRPSGLRRGMLKPEGPLPTDEELCKDYTAYLAQKHLKS